MLKRWVLVYRFSTVWVKAAISVVGRMPACAGAVYRSQSCNNPNQRSVIELSKVENAAKADGQTIVIDFQIRQKASIAIFRLAR
jgi:hypothetical protein